MLVNGLPLPERLLDLIADGRWPADPTQALCQHLLVPPQVIRALAPNELALYLAPPPFTTVSERIAHGEKFWTEDFVLVDGLDHERTIMIGDFGPGSDAPIVLDYRGGVDAPAVLRLRHDDALGGRSLRRCSWVELAATFDEFVSAIALETAFTGTGGRFSPDEGRCFAWVEACGGDRQPKRCAAPIVTCGWWVERADVWMTVDACSEHAAWLTPDDGLQPSHALRLADRRAERFPAR